MHYKIVNSYDNTLRIDTVSPFTVPCIVTVMIKIIYTGQVRDINILQNSGALIEN